MKNDTPLKEHNICLSTASFFSPYFSVLMGERDRFVNICDGFHSIPQKIFQKSMKSTMKQNGNENSNGFHLWYEIKFYLMMLFTFWIILLKKKTFTFTAEIWGMSVNWLTWILFFSIWIVIFFCCGVAFIISFYIIFDEDDKINKIIIWTSALSISNRQSKRFYWKYTKTHCWFLIIFAYEFFF